MNSYLRDPKHGPLPAMLLVLTVVTGVVDAVSILSLGRVFVANMTGNVVFTGFALAGAPGFSLSASLSALAGFLVGAGLGGLLVGARPHRGVLVRDGVALELLALVAALVVVVATARTTVTTSVVAALAAVALGAQNAVVRKLAVPDLTTTVLTMTLTGIAADVRSGNRATALRRVLAVAGMLLGAVAGALLDRHVGPGAALGVAVGLIAVVAVGATVVARGTAAWH